MCPDWLIAIFIQYKISTKNKLMQQLSNNAPAICQSAAYRNHSVWDILVAEHSGEIHLLLRQIVYLITQPEIQLHSKRTIHYQQSDAPQCICFFFFFLLTFSHSRNASYKYKTVFVGALFCTSQHKVLIRLSNFVKTVKSNYTTQYTASNS